MTAIILHGHEAAKRMLEEARQQVRSWTARSHRAPCLGLLATDTAATGAYLRRIEEYAVIAGVTIRRVDAGTDAGAAATLALVAALNGDEGVDGILALKPLPSGLNISRLATVIDPAKDVDGMTPANAGRLALGLDGLFPCTAQAALALAEEAVGSLCGGRATVVGASRSVGRPLAELLLQRGATVTVAHADTVDLPAACRTAEILFVAVGRPGLIDHSHVADGATVIDIGINSVPDGIGGAVIVGDVDLDSVRSRALAVSAVPDGVGPLTTAFLIRNTLASAGCHL